MLLWIPVFLLILLDHHNVVHASITYPIDVDRDCHGFGRDIFLPDEQLYRFESGDIFERLNETDSFDCRWNVKASNQTNGVIAIVEKLKLRKTPSGFCLDYIQFGLKIKGEWVDGKAFCDVFITEEPIGADDYSKPSVNTISRKGVPDDVKETPETLGALTNYKFLNGDGAVVDPMGDLRIFLHLGSPKPTTDDKMDFVINMNTYKDEGGHNETIDWTQYTPLEEDEEELKPPIAGGFSRTSLIAVILVVKIVLLGGYIFIRYYSRPASILVFRRLKEPNVPQSSPTLATVTTSN